MLNGILEDQERSSSDRIEEAITRILDGLTFDHVQSVFQNGMSHLARVLENGGEYAYEQKRS
jgi:hypothetical protein